MYKWSWVIFVKKSKFHDVGGPDTVVSPTVQYSTVQYSIIQYSNSTVQYSSTSVSPSRFVSFYSVHSTSEEAEEANVNPYKSLFWRFIHRFIIFVVLKCITVSW